MSSSDIAISPVEAQKLLKNANVTDPGVINPGRLEYIMREIKSYITLEAQQNGFTRKAMFITDSYEYYWAHNTAPGIIWLWAQQEDKDTRDKWINEPKSEWENFVPKEPSPDSPIRWPSTSPSASPSASRASGSAAVIDYGLSESIPPPGGGYRKRRTRKTRRKSSRRGRSRSRSRSRSRQIRRKKTHHRRHRR